jgi:voltage-gated potassium channel
MVTLRKILFWGASLLTIMALGSLGYMVLEGWDFFDSLYMTVITLTTVGFGEVHPLSRVGRAYTLVILLAGMGVMLYIVTSLAKVVVEGEIKAALGKRKLLKRIKKMHGHYIICGFGRIGEIIARQLSQRGISLVVVENNPEQVSRAEEAGYDFVNGDATREEVLQEAGIERAKGLVAVVGSDVGNVYITLTARSLNPRLFIVSRGEELGSEQKLLRAGADKVESPYEMGGRKMAHTILRPTVVTFMELAMHEGVEWSMEEIAVGPDSPIIGIPLKDSGFRQKWNLIVVAIKRADGEMIFNPTPESLVLAGDTLILLGMRKNLEALEEMIH